MENWKRSSRVPYTGDGESVLQYAEKMAGRDRHRQAAWDRRNLRTVSTHLTRQQAGRLQKICAKRGISQYNLIRRFLLAYIQADGAAGSARRRV